MIIRSHKWPLFDRNIHSQKCKYASLCIFFLSTKFSLYRDNWDFHYSEDRHEILTAFHQIKDTYSHILPLLKSGHLLQFFFSYNWTKNASYNSWHLKFNNTQHVFFTYENRSTQTFLLGPIDMLKGSWQRPWFWSPECLQGIANSEVTSSTPSPAKQIHLKHSLVKWVLQQETHRILWDKLARCGLEEGSQKEFLEEVMS